MAYTSLTVTYASARDADNRPLSSSFIPAYPEYTSATTFDSTFYTSRETNCGKLIGPLNDLNS
jgi:hypothetical protein